MSTLHTLNKSSLPDLLDSCFRMARPGDSILLIEDGVYLAGNPGNRTEAIRQLSTAGITFLALQPDLDARGIHPALQEFASADYEDFVRLSCEHDKTVSWF